MEDDVPADVKTRRFQELAQVYRQEAAILNNAEVGRQHLVLIEGVSWEKKNGAQLYRAMLPYLGPSCSKYRTLKELVKEVNMLNVL